jgi:hypothetical protein
MFDAAQVLLGIHCRGMTRCAFNPQRRQGEPIFHLPGVKVAKFAVYPLNVLLTQPEHKSRMGKTYQMT